MVSDTRVSCILSSVIMPPSCIFPYTVFLRLQMETCDLCVCPLCLSRRPQSLSENRTASRTINMLNTCHSMMARVVNSQTMAKFSQQTSTTIALQDQSKLSELGTRSGLVFSLEDSHLQFTNWLSVKYGERLSLSWWKHGKIQLLCKKTIQKIVS
jgi:hypothetical protein